MSEEMQDKEALSIEQKTLLEKAHAYAKSLASKGLSNKKTEPETKALRQLSCHGDQDLSPCSQRMNSAKFEGSFFCGACGCGDKKGTQLVDLTIDNQENYGKLDFPVVWCPLNMPGFQPYKPSADEPLEVRNKRKEEIEKRVSVEYIKDKSKTEQKK